MRFIDTLDRARAILEGRGRLSARALGRELEVEGDVQLLARREGEMLHRDLGPVPEAVRDEVRQALLEFLDLLP